MRNLVIKSVNRNPSRNWQIDPFRNWQIDPSRNWQIDPSRNWQIDPSRNWQIDPSRNWQINPSRNWQIDPVRSLNIQGDFVCSVQDTLCYYYTVKVNKQDVLLVFDADNNFCFYATGVSQCYTIFRVIDNVNIGYLCPNGVGKYNWFSSEGKWLYFFT